MNPIHWAKAKYRLLETYYYDRIFCIPGANKNIPSFMIQTDSPNKINSNSLASAQYRNIKALLSKSIELGYTGGTFFDIGSGYGRVCFYADEMYPGAWRRILGFDFSPNLIRDARIARNYNHRSVDFILGDAARDIFISDYRSSQTSLVFLFNPFNETVLRQFLRRNAGQSFGIAYCNDVHRDVLLSLGWICLWSDSIWKLSFWRAP